MRGGRSARSARATNCTRVPILAFNFTKYPNARRPLSRLTEKDTFDKWLTGARGYLTHTLTPNIPQPVWTAESAKPGVQPPASARSRFLASYIPGERRRRPIATS